MELNREQRKQFQEALVSAFPERRDLEMMLSLQLDVNSSILPSGASLIHEVFELIKWANSQGRSEELVRTSYKTNPGNKLLKSFIKSLHLDLPPVANSTPSSKGDVTSVVMTSSTPADELSLSDSIGTILKQNNYIIQESVNAYGSEIDIKATSSSDPFTQNTYYIKVSLDFVDIGIYNKYTSMFMSIKANEPNASVICVSATGFSIEVQEYARLIGVKTFTYNELFSQFQRFDPLVKKVLNEGDLAHDLAKLDLIYEEARFEDPMGKESATEFLSKWRLNPKPANPWIVVVGDYGTGKTALTKVLLRRWILDYHSNPSTPIPFRIELREFTKQFGARNLIFHFLDTNGLRAR